MNAEGYILDSGRSHLTPALPHPRLERRFVLTTLLPPALLRSAAPFLWEHDLLTAADITGPDGRTVLDWASLWGSGRVRQRLSRAPSWFPDFLRAICEPVPPRKLPRSLRFPMHVLKQGARRQQTLFEANLMSPPYVEGQFAWHPQGYLTRIVSKWEERDEDDGRLRVYVRLEHWIWRDRTIRDGDGEGAARFYKCTMLKDECDARYTTDDATAKAARQRCDHSEPESGACQWTEDSIHIHPARLLELITPATRTRKHEPYAVVKLESQEWWTEFRTTLFLPPWERDWDYEADPSAQPQPPSGYKQRRPGTVPPRTAPPVYPDRQPLEHFLIDPEPLADPFWNLVAQELRREELPAARPPRVAATDASTTGFGSEAALTAYAGVWTRDHEQNAAHSPADRQREAQRRSEEDDAPQAAALRELAEAIPTDGSDFFVAPCPGTVNNNKAAFAPTSRTICERLQKSISTAEPSPPPPEGHPPRARDGQRCGRLRIGCTPGARTRFRALITTCPSTSIERQTRKARREERQRRRDALAALGPHVPALAGLPIAQRMERRRSPCTPAPRSPRSRSRIRPRRLGCRKTCMASTASLEGYDSSRAYRVESDPRAHVRAVCEMRNFVRLTSLESSWLGAPADRARLAREFRKQGASRDASAPFNARLAQLTKFSMELAPLLPVRARDAPHLYGNINPQGLCVRPGCARVADASGGPIPAPPWAPRRDPGAAATADRDPPPALHSASQPETHDHAFGLCSASQAARLAMQSKIYNLLHTTITTQRLKSAATKYELPDGLKSDGLFLRDLFPAFALADERRWRQTVHERSRPGPVPPHLRACLYGSPSRWLTHGQALFTDLSHDSPRLSVRLLLPRSLVPALEYLHEIWQARNSDVQAWQRRCGLTRRTLTAPRPPPATDPAARRRSRRARETRPQPDPNPQPAPVVPVSSIPPAQPAHEPQSNFAIGRPSPQPVAPLPPSEEEVLRQISSPLLGTSGSINVTRRSLSRLNGRGPQRLHNKLVARGVSPFDFDVLLFPIHSPGHWTFAAIHVRDRRAELYDAYNLPNAESAREKLAPILRWLQLERRERNLPSDDPTAWPLASATRRPGPGQEDALTDPNSPFDGSSRCCAHWRSLILTRILATSQRPPAPGPGPELHPRHSRPQTDVPLPTPPGPSPPPPPSPVPPSLPPRYHPLLHRGDLIQSLLIFGLSPLGYRP
eukprot:tig00000178_g12753.t1